MTDDEVQMPGFTDALRGYAYPIHRRDGRDPDYIVTACMFCNVTDNRYFDLAEKRGLRVEGLTPDELIAQQLPYVRSHAPELP